jgi:hypothetical protein
LKLNGKLAWPRLPPTFSQSARTSTTGFLERKCFGAGAKAQPREQHFHIGSSAMIPSTNATAHCQRYKRVAACQSFCSQN